MDEKSNELMQHVREIQAESQVIWGEQDEILDVSGAEHLQKCVLKCKRVDILESCGHVITFDRPAKLVNLLLDFRGELHKRKRYLILWEQELSVVRFCGVIFDSELFVIGAGVTLSLVAGNS